MCDSVFDWEARAGLTEKMPFHLIPEGRAVNQVTPPSDPRLQGLEKQVFKPWCRWGAYFGPPRVLSIGICRKMMGHIFKGSRDSISCKYKARDMETRKSTKR